MAIGRRCIRVLLAALAAGGLTLLLSTAQAAARAAGAAPILVADWEMNDAPGSLTMVDATGSHDGAISADAASAGLP
jgi:hypothetical protein